MCSIPSMPPAFWYNMRKVLMAYALQSLLRIRTMREDRAGGELVAARRAVADAAEALERRRRVLADYEKTRESRRDRLYDTVIGHEVTREQLDKVKEGVSKIDEEGALKAEDVRRGGLFGAKLAVNIVALLREVSRLHRDDGPDIVTDAQRQ